MNLRFDKILAQILKIHAVVDEMIPVPGFTCDGGCEGEIRQNS